ncbi:histidine kinase [Paenibacillus sp. A3]|uniref:HD-GYP domain-containing protein n=1 Tax=Paenibacillus sp. A3 TaxID=1337054 RepID=UPI0006E57A6C|nr:HD domain-containing phosphohydrolase [Paenibacillus sp. A3]KPV59039.1 histidine kinase [Paenibacillus sp. A3]
MYEAHDKEERQAKEDLEPQEMLRVIFDYAAKICNERKLDRLLMLMADMGREMVVSDRCTVWLLDRDKDELYSTVAHEVPPLRISVHSGLVGLAVREGRPIFVDDAYANEEFAEVLRSGAIIMDGITGYRTKALMVVPFRNNEGEITGAFQAMNKLTKSGQFSQKDLEYLTLAASYAGKSLESALLSHEIEETQKEIIFTMGEIGENRSKETGNHVKRVAEYSYLLALGLGMSEEEAELLKNASPMHDIGKVAIPDAILKKPGKLTAEEFDVMKSHTTIGYSLLKNSKRRILKAAAIVALEHHEKWDGSGYPRGLRGEQIHIYGRITAIADVFDALGSERIYKKAWELDPILKLLEEERGAHFDPQIVDVFMEQLPKLLEVRKRYSDVALSSPASEA